MGKEKFVTLTSEALGVTECRLEGFDHWGRRWKSLVIFLAVVCAVPLIWRVHMAIKAAVAVTGMLAYFRFINHLDYESLVVMKGGTIQLETQWRFSKYRQRLHYRDLAGVLLHEIIDERYFLVILHDGGKSRAIGYKHTNPPPYLLMEVYFKIYDLLPRRLKKNGLGILTEPVDALEALHYRVTSWATLEWEYNVGALQTLWECCMLPVEYLTRPATTEQQQHQQQQQYQQYQQYAAPPRHRTSGSGAKARRK